MTRILLVEDEDLLRTSLLQLLARNGFDTEGARTATDALTLAERTTPDVLITDWLLQGECDGIELARRLRARHPALRVIVITGLLATDTRDAIAREGLVAAFVEKPFPFARLTEVLERIVVS